MAGSGRSKARGVGGASWRWLPLLVLLAIGSDASIGPIPPPGWRSWAPGRAGPAAFGQPDNSKLDEVRRAAASWDLRPGPAREVVDQVALVPDLAGLLEAIADGWDRDHWFPILIEDAESTPRFLRAFRPARVVRPAVAPRAMPPEVAWRQALAAIRASWSPPGHPDPGLAADAVPLAIAPTPPGLVLTAPDAPMFAAAVALAAGRFQPLIRFRSADGSGRTLSSDEFRAFDEALTARVARAIPHHGELGDDCDFLALAGDYPYRYRQAGSGDLAAVDDAIARSPRDGSRWAFAGRLLGGPADSVYRAMCGLFLATGEATLFNGYDEARPPWSAYGMRGPAARLGDLMPTDHRSGRVDGSLGGWHEAFDPWNRSSLVLINSHGSPTVFHLQDQPCGPADIPRTVPVAVAMIHSFAAADPTDPDTIAGRWLANGAFAFFGSMNEPYLAAFRSPRLVVDLIADRLPLAVALRQTMAEAYGPPWRLVYLGDPLYRVEPARSLAPRISPGGRSATWPVVGDADRPASADAPDAARLAWARDAALARVAAGRDEPGDDLIDTLGEIRRDQLPRALRDELDLILADALFHARRRSDLRHAIASIPEGDRSPALRRWHETILTIDLHLALAQGKFARAVAAWSELARIRTAPDVQGLATRLVGQAARTPPERLAWAGALRSALVDRPGSPEVPGWTAELARVGQIVGR